MSDKILPLYEGVEDARPLPLIVAEQFGFPLQYHDTADGVFYAVQDWIAGLASDPVRKASQTFAKMQDKMLISIQQLNYTAKDSKVYQVPFTDDEGLYKIAVYMRVTKNRPALQAIKDYLAKAGVLADLIRRDPETAAEKIAAQTQRKYERMGKPQDWILTREFGKVSRKRLMAVVHHLLGGQSGEIYKTVTDDTYIGLFGMPAWKMRQKLGLSAGANVRDYMSRLGLAFVMQAEELCALELEDYSDDDIVRPQDVRRVIQTLSRFVGEEIRRIEQRTQRSMLTGKRLPRLNDPNNIA